MDEKQLSPKEIRAQWFRVFDLPGYLILFFFGLALMAYLKLFSKQEEIKLNIDNKEVPWVTVLLWPFALSFVSILFGYSFDQKWLVYLCAVGSTTGLVALAIRTLRMAMNPFRPVAPLFQLMLEALFGPKSPMRVKLDANGNVRFLSGNPEKMLVHAALGIFLIYYAIAISLTIVLFGILLKASHPDWRSISSSDFLLGSLLRFTAGSNLGELFGAHPIRLWTLGIESLFSFYYLVIAILAFSTVVNSSAEEFSKDIIEFLKKLASKGSP